MFVFFNLGEDSSKIFDQFCRRLQCSFLFSVLVEKVGMWFFGRWVCASQLLQRCLKGVGSFRRVGFWGQYIWFLNYRVLFGCVVLRGYLGVWFCVVIRVYGFFWLFGCVVLVKLFGFFGFQVLCLVVEVTVLYVLFGVFSIKWVIVGKCLVQCFSRLLLFLL